MLLMTLFVAWVMMLFTATFQGSAHLSEASIRNQTAAHSACRGLTSLLTERLGYVDSEGWLPSVTSGPYSVTDNESLEEASRLAIEEAFIVYHEVVETIFMEDNEALKGTLVPAIIAYHEEINQSLTHSETVGLSGRTYQSPADVFEGRLFTCNTALQHTNQATQNRLNVRSRVQMAIDPNPDLVFEVDDNIELIVIPIEDTSIVYITVQLNVKNLWLLHRTG